MFIEEFINTTKDWEKVLAQAPYFIKIAWDGDYFILNYTAFASDMSNPIVQQCRGSIFYWHNDIAKCVCRPFDKFFNVQEENAVDLDWDSAVVTEKIDGSLMKWWFHDGQWHLSTNGTINAYKAPVNDVLSFGDIFDEVADIESVYDWLLSLDKTYTYLFELVSPITRVIVPYDKTMVYFLTAINTETKEEKRNFSPPCDIYLPKIQYQLRNLEDCLQICKELPVTQEGFVVVDKYNHRIKIKGETYLAAHILANNGAITDKRILRMMKDGVIDDFEAYLPQLKYKVDSVRGQLTKLELYLDVVYRACALFDRKELYKWVNVYPAARDYCYRKLDNPALTSHDYLEAKSPTQILNMLEMLG